MKLFDFKFFIRIDDFCECQKTQSAYYKPDNEELQIVKALPRIVDGYDDNCQKKCQRHHQAPQSMINKKIPHLRDG